eukprot:gnl/TRDRNA2_/TRDRNA2_75710_c0_seq1.p1 gnl/TRDRNA2_/TRDRNA2_75710_c0~~gnl/TRDRNA2_/TRDRNA2_75710_c0_seq1.p1  ORF type:complete len:177 (-),score=25.87 gnl/TRDRNA2_/TRDRNA2_75710_c0_seq1:32-562(-)
MMTSSFKEYVKAKGSSPRYQSTERPQEKRTKIMDYLDTTQVHLAADSDVGSTLRHIQDTAEANLDQAKRMESTIDTKLDSLALQLEFLKFQALAPSGLSRPAPTHKLHKETEMQGGSAAHSTGGIETFAKPEEIHNGDAGEDVSEGYLRPSYQPSRAIAREPSEGPSKGLCCAART